MYSLLRVSLYFAIFVKQIEAKFREKTKIFAFLRANEMRKWSEMVVKRFLLFAGNLRSNPACILHKICWRIITNIEYPAACLLETIMWCKLLQSEPLAVNPWKWIPCQGRIQDLSEGGGTKKLIIRNKKSCRRRNFFFDLKDSKRVKIND